MPQTLMVAQHKASFLPQMMYILLFFAYVLNKVLLNRLPEQDY